MRAVSYWFLGHLVTIVVHLLHAFVLAGIARLVSAVTGLPWGLEVPSYWSLVGGLVLLDGVLTMARLAWKMPRTEFVFSYGEYVGISVDPERRVKVPE